MSLVAEVNMQINVSRMWLKCTIDVVIPLPLMSLNVWTSWRFPDNLPSFTALKESCSCTYLCHCWFWCCLLSVGQKIIHLHMQMNRIHTILEPGILKHVFWQVNVIHSSSFGLQSQAHNWGTFHATLFLFISDYQPFFLEHAGDLHINILRRKKEGENPRVREFGPVTHPVQTTS